MKATFKQGDGSMNDYLSTGDTAKLLDRSIASVFHYEKSGRLKAIRTQGGIRLFLRSDVERLAKELRTAEGKR